MFSSNNNLSDFYKFIKTHSNEWNQLLKNRKPPRMSGGKTVFKRTSKKVTIQGRERCVYVGKHNKQYIKTKQGYVSLSSLKK